MYRFEPSRTFSACKMAAVRDAMDTCLSDQRKIVMNLHANRAHASAHQLKRLLVDSGGEIKRLVN